MLGPLPAARPVPLEPYPSQFRFSRRRAGPNDPDRSRPTRRRWTGPRRTRARSADPRPAGPRLADPRFADPRFAFGGDYNPEQWAEDIWDEDVALMRDAGVTVLTVAVVRLGRAAARAGVWDDEWLQRILDLLHRNGIAVDLAIATASPPPWLVRAHPEIRPVDARGTRLEIGGRQTWCPSSPVFREHSLNLVREMAGRFGDHPAVVMWARVQRIGRPQRQLPLRRQRRSFPGVAPGQMRGRRRRQSGLGHGFLESALF
jgi:hypothetical protein